MRTTKIIKHVSQLGLQCSQRCISSEPNRKRFAALWGNGDFGRLGLGTLDSQWSPSICNAFDDSLRAISCGGAHTLFLTENGRVYATGLNECGQLGAMDKKSYALEPLEVSGLPREVIQISAGYHHSSAITGVNLILDLNFPVNNRLVHTGAINEDDNLPSSDGELYMWGSNKNGQLGLGKSINKPDTFHNLMRGSRASLSGTGAAKIVPIPTKIDFLSGIRIKMVALGSEHSIAITDEGGALSWGAGGSGRLGHGHQSSFLGFLGSASEFMPRFVKQLEGIKIKTVSAGLLHSACTAENGSVFVFGEKPGFGGANHETSPSIVNELPFCDEIACGGYHTCVITCDNVFTWGWGGSNGTFSVDGYSSGGQLGHANDVDYYKPMMVNFGKNVKALQVSCGFNHTGALLEYT
ncbi:hypothetical protein GIB67_036197 [Kingdonia uniflora]|uniref:Ultraviolet-B receptor UVR8 n=1 Tax=Kingdonia uniflora TaxID=39325 RepID=A0A7J7L4X8_9MAGN|nr:hypothetical protein GIB67_036197 [Kingdonia uniflora]